MLNKLIRQFPPELQLMLASAAADFDKTKLLLQYHIKWDKFLRLAEHHRVYPSVYSTLRKLDNQSVPVHVLDVLKSACQENTMRALRLTGEMLRISSILENHDINAVVLKGVPLSWRLYGNIAARPYVDIDILVTADKLDQSMTILKNEGYIRINEHDSYNLTPRQLQIYLRGSKHSSHYAYWNSQKRVLIEIHWKLSKYGNVLLFENEGNTKKMVVEGNPLSVLPDEEWLLYLVLHGAGHKWQRLHWLLDIYKFIQQENIYWKRLEHKAEKAGVKSFLHQALILVNQLFGAELPTGLKINIDRDRNAWRLANLVLKAYILNPDEPVDISGIYSFFVNFSYDLYMNRGLQNKLNLILKLFGPTVEDIKMVALPDSLYVLYYIMGPLTFSTRRLQLLMKKNKHINTKKLDL